MPGGIGASFLKGGKKPESFKQAPEKKGENAGAVLSVR